ncbi:hypothetical protein [Melittangium boletus]|uniref:Lipoprotein n=1 Tax=Melittangium boletus DSM 14713 TaxID=1294270 RepID=A0A250ITK0_9BACT|nr:hypothetical protein [Melittangium boletus]ATB34517.1 hypothetical protein MEBOL_008022 [Melittangium boletus DSM 14713]
MRVSILSLLLLGLWARPASAEQELAVYPGTVHTRIGNDLVIGGEYHRMAYFTTKDSIPQVAKYFHEYWTKQGYPVVVEGDLKDEAVVAAFYTREGLQRAIVLRKHQGKTVGFSVLKDMWLYEKPSAAGKSPFVQMENSLFHSEVGSRDEAGATRSRTEIVERGLDEVRQELTSKLTASGFKLVRESGGKLDGQRTVVLEYARGAEQTLNTLVELESTRVAVSQAWVGTDRPDGMPNADAVRRSREEAARARQPGKKP